MSVQQITAQALLEKLKDKQPLVLLDVREPVEFEYAKIKGSQSIPLNQIPLRFQELDQDQEIIVICHHGVRSLQAAHFLIHRGFVNILNLSGGIDAWSRECDSTVPRY